MITSNITNLSQDTRLLAKVELYEGSTLVRTCTCSDVLQDYTIYREGDLSKFFGFGVCQKMSLNLIDLYNDLTVTTANTIEVAIGTGDEWDYPYPTFYVTEVNKDEDNNTITVTAYDLLYGATKYHFNELNLTAPYTLHEVIMRCASLLGTSGYVRTNFADDDIHTLNYPDGANLEGTEDIRSVLTSIAEVMQAIFYVDHNDALVFKRYSADSVCTIGKDSYFSLHTKTNRRLSKICNATELGDNLEASTGESGTTQFIRNNPFLELRTDIVDLLEDAIALVGGLTINQFDCEWEGNHLLEIGDKIALVKEDDSEVYSYVLSDTVTYDGALNEVTSWEYNDNDGETFSQPTSIGEAINQTFARVDKIEKNITLYVRDAVTEHMDDVLVEVIDPITGDIEKIKTDQVSTTEKITQLQLTTDGITSDVSSLKETDSVVEGQINSLQSQVTQNSSSLTQRDNEIAADVTKIETTTNENISELNNQINTLTKQVSTKVTHDELTIKVQEELANGVTTVTTETGFTFNEEGLTVRKTGREMSTTITEDGMTVYKNNVAMLTANNQGVEAKNLSASTYLTIGANSRLEDYQHNRTACFWIGG